MYKTEKFIDSEIIDEFEVNEERKKIWEIEIDLLQEFDRVCKENNLKYTIAYGTMLGAVRHKGFIPWDDDMDVLMPRDDYERLLKIGSTVFKGKYHLLSYKNEKQYYKTHAELKNSNTTAICKTEIAKPRHYNQGIFIDIFPLDGFPDKPSKANRLIKRLTKLNGIIAGYEYYKYHTNKTLQRKIKRVLLSMVNKKIVLWKYNRICSKNKYSNSELVSDVCFYRENSHVWKKDKIVDKKEYPFEYTSFIGIKEYDYFLKILYSDYNEIINSEKLHGDIFFDTERPYTYYLNEGRKELISYANTEH